MICTLNCGVHVRDIPFMFLVLESWFSTSLKATWSRFFNFLSFSFTRVLLIWSLSFSILLMFCVDCTTKMVTFQGCLVIYYFCFYYYFSSFYWVNYCAQSVFEMLKSNVFFFFLPFFKIK